MTNNNDLKDLFIKEPNVNMLLHIYRTDETWASKIASSQELSQQGTYDKINRMLHLGLVSKDEERMGSMKLIKLTSEGEKLARSFERTVREIEEVEQQ